jgi:hypothetical protein
VRILQWASCDRRLLARRPAPTMHVPAKRLLAYIYYRP